MKIFIFLNVRNQRVISIWAGQTGPEAGIHGIMAVFISKGKPQLSTPE
jgi:hypothetical protein